MQGTRPIVDAWMQHPTQEFLADPMLETLRRWVGMEGPPPEIPIEATAGAMEAGNVRCGLMSAWHGPRGPLITNDAVAAWIARYPGRFAGLAAVDLHRPMEAVRELRRCVRTLGFKGLRVVQWLWNLPPNDRRYYPLYAECIELDVPVCLQVGHTGPLCPSEPGRPIPYLDEVALDFPELKIVGGHVGFPWVLDIISLATKYPNVYIDTSAYKASRYPADLVAYMRGRGRKKVMFGTNYPMLTPDQALEGFDALGLDDEAAALFLHDNACRVFKLD